MINFNLKPYVWKESMDIIMQNVNLSKIEFLLDRSIRFEFLSSFDGSFYKAIRCHNVVKISEENNFRNGEEFPFFICDVRAVKLEKEDSKRAFEYMKYGMSIPDCSAYNFLCMDSGEISIQLICEMVEIL